MQSRFVALGLFSIAAIHPALAQQVELAAAPGSEPPGIVQQDGPGPMPWPGPPMWRGAEGFGPRHMGPPRFGADHRGPPPEFMLAARLAALETRIGVRSEQLDAWRDYTSALQAVLTPPRPDHGPRGPEAKGGPDAGGPDGSGSKANHAGRDPFAFQERLADDLTKRAVSAGKLKDAIAALRTALTPEQLEILASAERPHGPPPGPFGGPLDDAAGPGGPPDQGGQLPPPQPGNG